MKDARDGVTVLDDIAECLTKESVDIKLRDYLLNQNHSIGKSKEEWFKKALGFTQENINDLEMEYTTYLDWDYPLNPSPWTKEKSRFSKQGNNSL